MLAGGKNYLNLLSYFLFNASWLSSAMCSSYMHFPIARMALVFVLFFHIPLLILEQELPTSVTLWPSVKNKVVNLLGPDERVCPVLYHNNRGIKALTCNWINFFKSCRLRKGDECIFILEDEAETRFRIGVNRK